MPFQNPIVESIHDSCVQMERKIDNLETQMTFMSERINSLTNVVMEMSNTLKRIESTSNLQGSTSSADNFSHMPEIIEKPTKSFLNCQQSNYTQEQVRYFLNLWLRNEIALSQDDDADTRLLKRMRLNTYYQDLCTIGSVAIDREKLKMKRNNYNWEEKSFKSLELDYRKSMIDNFQRTAIDLHYPVNRCKNQWLAETLLAYMYHNRQSKRKSRVTIFKVQIKCMLACIYSYLSLQRKKI
ncbi:hypothetical protein BD560DRAFT_428947 [Blakeslea trispora]|nr:hypothetical protein BD560DRAFT_428947 [Blakeslea trispora]